MRGTLEALTYSQIKKIAYAYRDKMPVMKNGKEFNFIFPEGPGTIWAFVIRCNPIYTTNDTQRNNDWLVVIENRPDDRWSMYVYKGTADPKMRRKDIANTVPQIYLGNIRPHQWSNFLGKPRLAVCQDFCPVTVRRYSDVRTDKHKTKDITINKWFYDDTGLFGINIHNMAYFFNSSLGCFIIDGDSYYINEFRPLLERIQKTHERNIPVLWFQEEEFMRILNEVKAAA